MRTIITSLSIAAAALTLAGATLASDKADADSIVATEAAFAKRAAEIGNIPAFREFAAPGVIMFLPEPMVATDYLAKADWPGRIEWRPDFVAVSSAADLAVASGPSQWTTKDGVDPGYYMTVWVKQPDGSWKFALDRGTPGTPDLYSAPTAPPVVVVGTVTGASQATPAGLEAVLADELSRDAQGAIRKRLRPGSRLIRSDAIPAYSPETIAPLLAKDPATVTTTFLGGGMSKSSDLAYAYGENRWTEGGKPRRGHYVRIWRRTGEGWTILVDHQTALPPPRD